MKKLCFDFDASIFRAAAANQERSIICTHLPTGNVEPFKTRTEFYGHWKAKSGGWLAAHPELKLEDFSIEDVVKPLPLEFALNSVKLTIQGMLDQFETDQYYGYVGGAKNFRKEICTLLPYKGQRPPELPIHLAACKEYVITHHKAKTANGVEADDLVCTDAHNAIKDGKELICIVLDKDFKGCDGNWYFYLNSDKRKVRGLGKLWKSGPDVDGYGRMFKYWQACSADQADNYKAHCFSDFENGPVKAYEALVDCKTDKEAFEAMVRHFKYLYPEPKAITNWRGDTFKIDWLYVMQEMFDMAHLQRWPGDRINVREVMNKLGVKYE